MKNNFNYQFIFCLVLAIGIKYNSISQCDETLAPESNYIAGANEEVLLSFLNNELHFQAEVIYRKSEAAPGQAAFFNAVSGRTNLVVIIKTDASNFIGGYNAGGFGNDGSDVFNLDDNFIFNLTEGVKFKALPGAAHIYNSPWGPDFNDFSVSITSSAASNCSAGSASYQCECSDFCGPAHLNSGIVDGGTSLISYDDIEVLQLKTSGIPVGNQLDLDNDGVCLFDEVYGCDDLSACNYDDAVTELDDSCTYPENHIPSDYCFPDFESCASDYIDSFQTEGAILNIENLNSGCSNGQYTYYDEHSLVVTSGSIINYSLTAGSFGQYFSIALDANQNGSFESSEFLFIKTDSRVTNFSDIIEIPDGIEPGSYRMRVQNWYYELALANLDCPFGDFGNVQDYDLVVIEPPVSGCAGDLNGDGIVSSTDLSTFLSTFGTSCED